MSKFKIITTPRSFAKDSDAPIKLLEENGCEVIRLSTDKGDLCNQIVEYLPTVDGVIAGLETYTKEMLEIAKNLKVISRYGVGYDNVDIEAAKKMGIKVTITPGANGNSVADLAFSLMLDAARNVTAMHSQIVAGKAEKPLVGVEMWQKTIGVIGTGRIGKGVIERALGFDMRILAYDTYQDADFMKLRGGEYVSLETLLRESDFITLHAPSTEDTKNMINESTLKLMKKRAILVNTARGDLVDEKALYEALKSGQIGGAGLDATVVEPPSGNPLTSLSNCILTPHAGAATFEASYNMGMMAAENVLDVLQNRNCKWVI